MGLTYDTGALLAAERNDRRMWAIHRRALERVSVPTVPAGVVVEAWRGGVSMARLLRGCEIEALEDGHARAAGLLLGASGQRIEAVDATVAACALRRGDAVVTSNRSHLRALADAGGRHLAVVDV